MNPINTGRFIRMQRKKLNLSQSALAAMLFVEPQTVSKWERGLGMPDYDNLDKLREIFACSLSDILGLLIYSIHLNRYFFKYHSKQNIHQILLFFEKVT